MLLAQVLAALIPWICKVAKGLLVASELLDEFLVVEAGAILLADEIEA